MTGSPAQAVFITGSGTEIGKTFVARLLIAQLRRRGRPVRGLKPVATGLGVTPPEATDSAHLLRAAGREATGQAMDEVTPWAFSQPLSPDMAAAYEESSVPFEDLVDFCRRAATARAGGSGVTLSEDGVTVIEGIGGVMTPLDARHTVLDWIAALGVPALLVSGSYLGALSHALTAAGMLAARGCPLLGVIVSESLEQPVPPEKTVETLTRFLYPTQVRLLPRLPAPDPDLAPDLTSLLDRDTH